MGRSSPAAALLDGPALKARTAGELRGCVSVKVFCSVGGGRSSVNSSLGCKVRFCPRSAAGAGRAGRGRSVPVSRAAGHPEGWSSPEPPSPRVLHEQGKLVTYY